MTQPTTCPACGCLNQCALANATEAPCWCFTAEVDPAALAALPASLRNQTCLCPRCALGASEPAAPPGEAKHAD